MAFQHEDGTGNPDAVSYMSVPDADEFHSLRSSAEAWNALAEPAKQAALVDATDWIEAYYSDSFIGNLLMSNQGLSWPRYGVIDPTTGNEYPMPWMPKELTRATALLALEASKGALVNNADPTNPQLIEKTTGPITKKYNPLKPNEIVVSRQFDFVRQTLAPLLRGRGMMLRTARY